MPKESEYVTMSTPGGLSFKIDKEDTRLLTGKTVHATGSGIRIGGEPLGRVILGISDNRAVRHLNGDSLDFRKRNLETTIDRSAVLKFVRSHIKTHLGVPPTLRDVCTACDVSSLSMAKRMLEELCESGELIRVGAGSRSYTLPEMIGLVERIK